MSKRTLYRKIVPALCCVLILGVMTACNGGKNVTDKPINGKSSGFLTKRLKANEFDDFQTLSAKIGSRVEMKGKTFNFKSSLRMRRDSAIWISMSPAMGIEAARVLITTDSLKFINKLEKTYWIGSFEDAREMLKADLSYEMLQDFILGNALEFDFEDGKYKSSVDSTNHHLLTSKNPKKVRNAIEMKKDDRNHFESDSTQDFAINDKKLEKALEKVGNEELIIMRYWLKPDLYRTSRIMINDLANKGVLEINYDKHEQIVPSFWMPMVSSLFITDFKEEAKIELDYSKVKINRDLSFPFRITDKYEKFPR